MLKTTTIRSYVSLRGVRGRRAVSLRQTEQAGETLAVAVTPQATIERVNIPDVEEVGFRKGRSHAGLLVELV